MDHHHLDRDLHRAPLPLEDTALKTCLALALVLLLASDRASAQSQTLDLLDGETLYDGGSLVTWNYNIDRREQLWSGNGRVDDPLHAQETRQESALAWHYGLKNTIQLGAIVPYEWNSRLEHTPQGKRTLRAEGVGDATLLGKWRFYRWDAAGVALNAAGIAGLETPTGSPREKENGVRLDPDLQPGSGSWDPFAGLGLTHEPGRWRFNSFVLYKRNNRGETGYKFGDEFAAEVAVGNRFWLQPYPGPFMRLDLALRFRHEMRDADGSDRVEDSGGDEVTCAINYAFRPRPSLDFQVEFETPIYQYVYGTQMAQAYTISFNIGFRF